MRQHQSETPVNTSSLKEVLHDLREIIAYQRTSVDFLETNPESVSDLKAISAGILRRLVELKNKVESLKNVEARNDGQ